MKIHIMSELIVDNYIINSPIIDILQAVKSEIGGSKLSVIQQKGDNVTVTCPDHADGHESHPSCYVYSGDGDMEYGWAHCFTCGLSCNLVKFISICFNSTYDYAKSWLISNFGKILITTNLNLPDIVLEEDIPNEITVMDESILDTFESYHPYMTKRKLTDEVIKNFEIKYDPKTHCIVFPVRNKYGELVYLTRRSVLGKKFIIDSGIRKEVYLLYDIIKNDSKEVYICESQINSLVCNSYGKKAVAMFGAGCPDYQISDLNNTDVLHYIIAFDPDAAGLKGIKKLCKYLNKLKFVSVMVLPPGKDVGDLTQEEFNNCQILDKREFLSNIPDYYK